jgi:hypothetical protein
VVLEKKILKYFLCIFTLLLLSPLSDLNKLESPYPNDDLSQVWLKLAMWFWRRFLKYFLYIFTLLLLSPLGEGRCPSFEQTWIPSPQGWFVPSLVKIGRAVLEKKSKM